MPPFPSPLRRRMRTRRSSRRPLPPYTAFSAPVSAAAWRWGWRACRGYCGAPSGTGPPHWRCPTSAPAFPPCRTASACGCNGCCPPHSLLSGRWTPRFAGRPRRSCRHCRSRSCQRRPGRCSSPRPGRRRGRSPPPGRPHPALWLSPAWPRCGACPAPPLWTAVPGGACRRAVPRPRRPCQRHTAAFWGTCPFPSLPWQTAGTGGAYPTGARPRPQCCRRHGRYAHAS